jgi:hypothetical protein
MVLIADTLALVPSELQFLVLFYDEASTHLFARTTYHTQEVGR